ncbi:MAG: hypothetical protein WCD53_11665 [Microcoleus sp.]
MQPDRALWYSFTDDVIFAKLEEPFFQMNTEKLEKIKADLARSRSWLQQIKSSKDSIQFNSIQFNSIQL